MQADKETGDWLFSDLINLIMSIHYACVTFLLHVVI